MFDNILKTLRDPENLNKVINCKVCGKTYTPVHKNICEQDYYYHIPNCKCELMSKLENHETLEEKKQRENLLFSKYKFLINYKNFDNEIFKTLDDEQLKTISILKTYQDDYLNNNKKSLYIYGSSGTGKTTMVKKLLTALNKKGVESYFIDTQKLLSDYKNSYNNNVDYSHTEYSIDNLVTSDKLIVFDDIGAEKPSEWTVSKFMQIFNERVELKRPTIVTTNYSPEELVDRFGQAVGSIEAKRLVGRMIFNSMKIANYTKDYRF